MTDTFRQWPEAPLILVGKATLVLLEYGGPVSIEAIRECVAGLTAPEDADLVARTLKYLDEHPTLPIAIRAVTRPYSSVSKSFFKVGCCVPRWDDSVPPWL